MALTAPRAVYAAPAAGAAPTPTPTPAMAPKHPALVEDSDAHIRAEVQERIGKGHYRFRGFVDLAAGDLRVQADEVDVFEEEAPGGKLTRRMEAHGDVVFIRDNERLSGTRAVLDIDSGRGTLYEARGFLDPGVFIEADEIERVDAKHYKIRGGRFTSCYQPNPRWSFTAYKAKVKVKSYILATAADLHVYDVPTPLFLPVFYYPISDEQRSTGFLIPQISTSSYRGFGFTEQFFWAMSRSFDQTLTFENFSKLGTGYGHEFRYLLQSPSGGTLSSYAFHRRQTSTTAPGWDYTFDWQAAQALPEKWMFHMNVHQYSSTTFQGQIQQNLEIASSRNEQISVGVSRHFGFGDLLISGNRTGTFFPNSTATPTTASDATPTATPMTTAALAERIQERLPSVQLSTSRRAIGRSGINFDYSLRADELGFGDETKTDRYGRYDAYGGLSTVIGTDDTFYAISPSIHGRFTHYGALQVPGTDPLQLTDEALDRKFFVASLDLTGPRFARVFLNEGGAYADKFKHEISPSVNVSYTSHIDRFQEIPQFDDVDRAVGTVGVTYKLSQALKAKRPLMPGSKPQATDVLTWVVQQTWYSQEQASQYDAAYQSTQINTTLVPGATPLPSATPIPVPHHLSPVLSTLTLTPSRQVSGNFKLEYDPYAHGIRRMDVGARLSLDRVRFDGLWLRSSNTDATGTTLNRVSDTLHGSAMLKVVPDKITLQGQATYDLLQKQVLDTTAAFRYDVQCCGLVVEYHRLQFGGIDNKGFSFRIHLANLGSATGFNNPSAGGPLGTGGGGRY